ncbi:hypothetical protein MtrunA17_Chr3g0140221 [Medicago truncatula]|uniref:Transmembrane protein, putative n=1 Tax=Medicago truncatula TaxID=3880 RepID=A0A072VD19_MEDTR|nr:transmembrane protein, putative [Medicago truncatula]RHN70874.1 hypothetical protein MtrunA17_Chr3g0140221 [Medicago truncatula]
MSCFSTWYQSMIGIHLEQFFPLHFLGKVCFSRAIFLFFLILIFPLFSLHFRHFPFSNSRENIDSSFVLRFSSLSSTFVLDFHSFLSVSINSILRFCFHRDLFSSSS